MANVFIHTWQTLIYGVLKRTPNIDFSEIPKELTLIPHYDRKNDVHWVESPDLPEFYVSGKTSEDLAHHVADTLLVYFDVPTYFANRFKEQAVFSFQNQKTGEQEYVHLNKEELDKVLA